MKYHTLGACAPISWNARGFCKNATTSLISSFIDSTLAKLFNGIGGFFTLCITAISFSHFLDEVLSSNKTENKKLSSFNLHLFKCSLYGINTILSPLLDFFYFLTNVILLQDSQKQRNNTLLNLAPW